MSLKIEESYQGIISHKVKRNPSRSIPMKLYEIIRFDWGAGSPHLGCGGGATIAELTVKRCTVSGLTVTLQCIVSVVILDEGFSILPTDRTCFALFS